MKPILKIEEMSIDKRLDNWGHCQRGKGGGSMTARETRSVSPYGGQGYKCMTNVICTMMREAAVGPQGSAASQARLDFADGALIQEAWLQLGMRHKLLLRDYYVLKTQQHVICRRMEIKHWPTSHWQGELSAAHAAIEKAVQAITERRAIESGVANKTESQG